MLRHLLDYLSNPFDRKKLSETHDPIINELKRETVRVKRQQEKIAFPISRTVSNAQLRKEKTHHA